MTIDWVHFSPVSATGGGLLIGLSASLLWLGLGRIAGISGIVGGAFGAKGSDLDWRLAFVIGLIVAPIVYGLAIGAPLVQITTRPEIVLSSGLLVGFGTQLGSGCTSGHGVCGIARLSPRSMIATLLFMASGFVTTYLLRHVVGG